jgi:hypothetical protein
MIILIRPQYIGIEHMREFYCPARHASVSDAGRSNSAPDLSLVSSL